MNVLTLALIWSALAGATQSTLLRSNCIVKEDQQLSIAAPYHSSLLVRTNITLDPEIKELFRIFQAMDKIKAKPSGVINDAISSSNVLECLTLGTNIAFQAVTPAISQNLQFGSKLVMDHFEVKLSPSHTVCLFKQRLGGSDCIKTVKEAYSNEENVEVETVTEIGKLKVLTESRRTVTYADVLDQPNIDGVEFICQGTPVSKFYFELKTRAQKIFCTLRQKLKFFRDILPVPQLQNNDCQGTLALLAIAWVESVGNELNQANFDTGCRKIFEIDSKCPRVRNGRNIIDALFSNDHSTLKEVVQESNINLKNIGILEHNVNSLNNYLNKQNAFLGSVYKGMEKAQQSTLDIGVTTIGATSLIDFKINLFKASIELRQSLTGLNIDFDEVVHELDKKFERLVKMLTNDQVCSMGSKISCSKNKFVVRSIGKSFTWELEAKGFTFEIRGYKYVDCLFRKDGSLFKANKKHFLTDNKGEIMTDGILGVSVNCLNSMKDSKFECEDMFQYGGSVANPDQITSNVFILIHNDKILLQSQVNLNIMAKQVEHVLEAFEVYTFDETNFPMSIEGTEFHYDNLISVYDPNEAQLSYLHPNIDKLHLAFAASIPSPKIKDHLHPDNFSFAELWRTIKNDKVYLSVSILAVIFVSLILIALLVCLGCCIHRRCERQRRAVEHFRVYLNRKSNKNKRRNDEEDPLKGKKSKAKGSRRSASKS